MKEVTPSRNTEMLEKLRYQRCHCMHSIATINGKFGTVSTRRRLFEKRRTNSRYDNIGKIKEII